MEDTNMEDTNMEDHSSSVSVTGRKLLVLWLIFLLYLLFGGLIFHLLEKGHEDMQREKARDMKIEFMENYSCLDDVALDELISSILEIQNQGVDPRGNATGPSKWDFTSSLFFSGTVVTTIGYGYIAPSSKRGQQFCICYALIGIPLCGFVLAALGERIKNCSLKFKERVCNNERFNRAEFFYMGMICISGFFIFFAIPAVIFSHVENWSYHTSFYYTFITLSTIGFGDYVAGTNTSKNYNIIYRILIYFWIIFGLVYFIILLGHVSDMLSSASHKLRKKSHSVREKKQPKMIRESKKMEIEGEIYIDKDTGNFDHESISLQQFDKNAIETQADIAVGDTEVQSPVDSDEKKDNKDDAEMEIFI